MLNFSYFSTFSGIGGFEFAIQKVFPNAECVGFSEYDKFPMKMYRHNFPNHRSYGDITKIDFNSLPDFQVLVGGSPCQSHSRIGNGLGFNDPRGQLFFDYIRLLTIKKPKAFVFENVDNLARGKRGIENMKVVLGSIIEAGYVPTYRILNANDFGIPQSRNRLFVVGIRKDIYEAGFRYTWPEKIPLTVTFADFLDKPGDIQWSLFWNKEQADRMDREYVMKTGRIKSRMELGYHQDSDRESSRTIVANIGKGFPCDFIIDRTICKYGFWTCEFAATDVCTECEHWDTYQETYDGSAGCRKWSSWELERMFGFPEGSSNVRGFSMSRLKKAFGNSVVVPVVEHVMKGLAWLEER